ncbi:MAG: LysM peptidoglycan-binding domain-containing protein [Chloroflexi bacterium]|nr:LysM peptidoglycan-binding domain-containing protein [Chloroflexota bacterium]
MATSNPSNTSTLLCPTCGTRVSDDQSRCLVCGTDLKPSDKPKARPKQALQGSRMPEVTLGLPVVILLFAIFLIAGGLISYYAFAGIGGAIAIADDSTPTATSAPTLTPTPVTPTLTFTPQPSPTPLTYIVQPGDTCNAIGFAFNVSFQSIILLNDLDAACSNLVIGAALLIPHPTPTPTPAASSTFTGAEATRQACETNLHIVQEGETLSLIALIFGVPEEAILDWNGLTVSTVFTGQRLDIPLCERVVVSGATVTPSPAPAYPAPELLLPLDGAFFSLEDDSVVLQWSSVGTLRDNEAYQITIIDVTDGETAKKMRSQSIPIIIANLAFERFAESFPLTHGEIVTNYRAVVTDGFGDKRPQGHRFTIWVKKDLKPTGVYPYLSLPCFR